MNLLIFNLLINVFMEIECPNCGCEDAYFNGRCYECPNCGNRWTDDDEEEDDD